MRRQLLAIGRERAAALSLSSASRIRATGVLNVSVNIHLNPQLWCIIRRRLLRATGILNVSVNTRTGTLNVNVNTRTGILNVNVNTRLCTQFYCTRRRRVSMN